MIPTEQVKAARKLLGWSRVRLAGRSALSESTVAKFETGAQRLSSPHLQAIRQALEVAGVEFTNAGEPGVRLKAALAAKA
jgi:transcriptional regulator with XRE-family HTH domain